MTAEWPKERPISILAGGGKLPSEIAACLRQKEMRVQAVLLTGIASPMTLSDVQIKWVGLGEISKMLSALKANGAGDMVIAGSVKRPALSRLGIDIGFLRHLGSILGLMRGGDDRVLRRVANFFEKQGLKVRGLNEVAPELLTPSGRVAGGAAIRDPAGLARGMGLVQALSPFDIGQAVVLERGAVVAIEGAEGTDGLLSRTAKTYKGNGYSAPPDRLLIKCAKANQDLRLDLPTVGPRTVELCAASGVAHIALDAGRSVILSPEETRSAAIRAGVTIEGVDTASSQTHGSRAKPMTRLAADRPRIGCLTKIPRYGNLLADIETARNVVRVLCEYGPRPSAMVVREHVLAVGVDEEPTELLQRISQLRQWGDHHKQRQRRGVVIFHGLDKLARSAIEDVKMAQLAAVVLHAHRLNERSLRELVRLAHEAGVGLLDC